MSELALEQRCDHGYIRSQIGCRTCDNIEQAEARAKALPQQVPHPTVDRPHLAWPPTPLPPMPKREEMLTAGPKRGASIDAVIACVADSYEVSKSRLLSGDRHKTISEARGVTCWLLRKLNGLSYPELGRVLNGRDHTTVMSAIKRVLCRRATEPRFAAYTDELAAAVAARMGVESGPERNLDVG